MTSSEAESTVTAADGVQQIPVVIQTAPVPAAADARDKLLAAIGAEAQHLAEKSPGQASAALAELAHAYALVTAGPTSASPLPVAGRAMTILPLDSKNSATLLVTPA